MQVKIFPGQPLFSQALELIKRGWVDSIAQKHRSDRYYKHFRTYEHLVAMLFAVCSGSTSLRGLSLGLLAGRSRLSHLGLSHVPRRSTISDANKNRSSTVFAEVYQELYRRLAGTLPDSRKWRGYPGKVLIIDSTTVSLFSTLLKTVGRIPINGKRKGGIKVHTVIDAREDLPQFICYSSAAAHDRPYIKGLKPCRGDMLVFDMAYVDHRLFESWTQKGIWFVTRERKKASYEVLKVLHTDDATPQLLSDQLICITIPKTKRTLELRRVEWINPSRPDEPLVFWTNLKSLPSQMVADLYRQRWQIELLFKRLKQNFPLKYFLGDNVNAIEIQIWCCLIAHFLYKLILSRTSRKWAFSNFCDVMRQHLFTYIDLRSFVDDPEKALRTRNQEANRARGPDQLRIF